MWKAAHMAAMAQASASGRHSLLRRAARAPAMLREVWAALKETAVQTYWLSRKNLLLLVRRLIRVITYRTVAGREAEPHSAHRARPCLDIIPILSRKRRRLRLRRPRIHWLASLALPPPDRPHVLRLSSALDGAVFHCTTQVRHWPSTVGELLIPILFLSLLALIQIAEPVTESTCPYYCAVC